MGRPWAHMGPGPIWAQGPGPRRALHTPEERGPGPWAPQGPCMGPLGPWPPGPPGPWAPEAAGRRPTLVWPSSFKVWPSRSYDASGSYGASIRYGARTAAARA